MTAALPQDTDIEDGAIETRFCELIQSGSEQYDRELFRRMVGLALYLCREAAVCKYEQNPVNSLFRRSGKKASSLEAAMTAETRLDQHGLNLVYYLNEDERKGSNEAVKDYFKEDLPKLKAVKDFPFIPETTHRIRDPDLRFLEAITEELGIPVHVVPITFEKYVFMLAGWYLPKSLS